MIRSEFAPIKTIQMIEMIEMVKIIEMVEMVEIIEIPCIMKDLFIIPITKPKIPPLPAPMCNI